MAPPHEILLLRRIRAWTLVFIFGLVLSGATAIPLATELNYLVRWTGADRIAQKPQFPSRSHMVNLA